jgi:serine/threonine protein kinase
MWSLGVVLYRMLTGRYPFHDSDPARLFDKIVKGGSAIEFPATVSDGARAVLRKLLDRNPRVRPTADALMKEPWLRRVPGISMVAMLRRRSSLGSLLDADETAALAALAESFASKGPPADEADDGLCDQMVPDMADSRETQVPSNPPSPVRSKYTPVGLPRKRSSTEWATVEDEPERCTKHKTASTDTLQGLTLTF